MVISLLLLACTGGPADTGGADAAGPADTGSPPPPCPVDAVGSTQGQLRDPDLVETSGIVVSRADPQRLWLHNDSGNAAVIHAISPSGAPLGAVEVTGASADDWEDIAIGPGPKGEGDWLFIGDIGDNSVSDGIARIAMLAEPDPDAGSVVAQELDLPYPDGPHDAEAMLVDPIGGDLYIITKETGAPAQVFATTPFSPVQDLRHVATVDLADAAEGILALVTGADVSPDGRCVFVRTYTHLLGYPRDPAMPLESAFDQQPALLTVLPEPQGESVAADARGYWTVSEGQGAELHRYEVP